jgi:hypothetical protein
VHALKPQPTPPGALEKHDSVPLLRARAERSPLGALESLLISKVDGHRTIEELASLVHVTPTEVASMLARLAELGLLRFAHEATAPSSREPTSENMPTLRGEGS